MQDRVLNSSDHEKHEKNTRKTQEKEEYYDKSCMVKVQ